LHQTRLKIAADELQHPFVLHLTRHPRHQDVVVDSVEELLQIKIDHETLAGPHIPLRGLHRLMGVATRAKGVTRLGESGLEDRLHNLQQCLLDQSIHQRRYPEHALPA
jgi:hypothetical protein